MRQTFECGISVREAQALFIWEGLAWPYTPDEEQIKEIAQLLISGVPIPYKLKAEIQ